MKHHKLKHYERHIPGYTAPQPPKSNKGKGFPHLQSFRRPK